MDREELMSLVLQGPIKIRMNDGREYDVVGRDHIVVSEIAAAVLAKNDQGEFRLVYLPLVTMTAVEPVAA